MLLVAEAVELLTILFPQTGQVGDRNTNNTIHGVDVIHLQRVHQHMKAISQLYIVFVTHE